MKLRSSPATGHWPLPLIFLLLCGQALPTPAAQCVYNAECRADECAVSDPHGGMKCVSSQYAVMVWDADCITALAKSLRTKMEAPLKDDESGEPDMEKATVAGLLVNFNRGCGRIEVRKR
jgi:hypothetical protein